MKKQIIAILALTVLALTGVPKLHAQNIPPPATPFSIITYQGKLEDGIGPMDGRYDIRVSAVTPPIPCFGTDCGWFTNCQDCTSVPLGTSTVSVDKGLFTLPINMPTGMVHTVNGTYLEFEVRPSGNGEFSTLLPMQRITAAPLATVAQSVVGPIDAGSLIGSMPTGMLTGIFSSPLTLDNQLAVRAANGIMIEGTTTTLDLRGDGAIRVAGAGVASRGPVFIHRATAGSISGHMTTIDHPLANGDPNAILLVTHNFSADTSSTPYETSPVGVWYNGSKWVIYHENTSVPMPAGRAFNVMVINP
jgi:hypothetical protein